MREFHVDTGIDITCCNNVPYRNQSLPILKTVRIFSPEKSRYMVLHKVENSGNFLYWTHFSDKSKWAFFRGTPTNLASFDYFENMAGPLGNFAVSDLDEYEKVRKIFGLEDNGEKK